MVVFDSKEKEEVLTDYIEGRIIFLKKKTALLISKHTCIKTSIN